MRDVWSGIQSAVSFHFSQLAGRELGADTVLLFNTWMGLVHHYLANGDLFAPKERVIPRYADTLVTFYIKLAEGIGRL